MELRANGEGREWRVKGAEKERRKEQKRSRRKRKVGRWEERGDEEGKR